MLRCILIIEFIFALCALASAQNLIQNGGFEAHGKIECQSCYSLFGKYSSVVYYWDNMGWGCFLCDQDYNQTEEDKTSRTCPIDKIPPQSGKAMIEMEYSPSTTIAGSASYLSARSTQPLLVGHLYEVNIWLYIPSILRVDPDWAQHISIALLPQPIKFNTLSESKVLPKLPIDTVVYDAWYPVKWRIRPLCNSQYIVIGVFADDRWPKSLSYKVAKYYLDDISIKEINTAAISADSSNYYCSLYDPQKHPEFIPQLEETRLLFETNAYHLTLEHRLALDSFAAFAKRFPNLVFEISGHTDSIGTENLILSQNRARAVLQYLVEVKNLPEFRFLSNAQASHYPFRSNSTDAGREQNRRVEIRQLNVDISVVFYQKALEAAAANETSSVFSYLNKWLAKTHQTEHMILHFDPRFDYLHHDKRWALLAGKVKEGYRKYKYPKYTYLIDSLRLDDNRVMGELSWEAYEWSPDSTPFRLERMPRAIIEQQMKAHFIGLKPMLDKIGWPKRSEFGSHAATSAFFLLQHSNDSSSLVKWLPVLLQTCEAGEADWTYYAMLYDRCQLIAGKKQRYGTHVKFLGDGTAQVEPWEGDIDTINDFRAKIGMPLLPDIVEQAITRESKRK
jgi:outer membrane protein OmpA-like peptidoglycan-associated protein